MRFNGGTWCHRVINEEWQVLMLSHHYYDREQLFILILKNVSYMVLNA